MASEPTTLQEAILYFADPANCRAYLVARRWPKGVECPRCGSKDVLFLEKYNRWHCRKKHDAPQFTLKTGTIMEDSPIGFDKYQVIDHAVAYVEGTIHTNGRENFWSLLKARNQRHVCQRGALPPVFATSMSKRTASIIATSWMRSDSISR